MHKAILKIFLVNFDAYNFAFLSPILHEVLLQALIFKGKISNLFYGEIP